MKKFYAFFLLYLLLSFNSHFAQIQFLWGSGVGSNADDFAEDMRVDKFGNSYCTGHFNSSVDFDPGPGVLMLTPAGGMDVYIAKANSAGNLVWIKRLGGLGDELAGSICQDAQHHIYVSGWFNGTADFDPGAGVFNMTSSGVFNAFVCKLDSGGNFIWAKQFGGSDETYGKDVTTDSLGNVYVTGRFKLSGDFDPGSGAYNLTSAGSGDVFMCKLTASGNFVWAKSIGQVGNDGGSTLINWGADIFVAGWFTNTCDLDPGAGSFNVTSNGSNDIFILKLDTSGTFLWGGSMGGALLDDCQDLAADSLGNIYATGFFEGTSDFNPGVAGYTLVSAGSEDVFVMKMNSLGILTWARVMGGASQDNGRGIMVANGNVFTTGFFSHIADLDPNDNYNYNLISAGSSDIFLSQFDMNGNFVTAVGMGGAGSDIGNAIGLDSSGGVYIHGSFGGYTMLPADLDPGPGSFTISSTNSTYDIFLAKYKGSARDLGVSPPRGGMDQLDAFPNPTNGQLVLNSAAKFQYLNVLNMRGELVKHFEGNALLGVLDLSDLAGGIYLLQGITYGKRLMQKIVKQ